MEVGGYSIVASEVNLSRAAGTVSLSVISRFLPVLTRVEHTRHVTGAGATCDGHGHRDMHSRPSCLTVIHAVIL